MTMNTRKVYALEPASKAQSGEPGATSESKRPRRIGVDFGFTAPIKPGIR